MPWKNGQGITEQIAVDPDGGWRISAATVRQEGPFSQYKNRERLLAIWQGEGLQLNDKILKPGEVFKFHGETPIYCKNLSAEVIDLGVVYDSSQFDVQLSFENFEVFQCSLEDLNFIFCAKGYFQMPIGKVSEGDTFKTHGYGRIKVSSSAEDLQLICIRIQKRN